MAVFLGIDTSNYTTSLALYNSETKNVIHKRKLLPVKEGSLGLRQSDALFHHTVQLPELFQNLFSEYSGKIDAVCVSERPRSVDGSYMPCFLAGVSAGQSVASSMGIPLYKFSHQDGHIAAALFSADRMDLMKAKQFAAFHVSGGTTEAVLVKPNDNGSFSTQIICASSDLKAGQAIDRVGTAMGLKFPAGKSLDELSLKSKREYKIKPYIKDGNCSLSGVENKCMKMIKDSESPEDVAKYCLTYVGSAICEMCGYVLEKYPDITIVFAGGVLSNTLIRGMIKKNFADNAVFSLPEFSSDNAAGIAVLGEVVHDDSK